MATYYVIRSNGVGAQVVAKFTTKPGEITYTPVIRESDEYAISIIDKRQVDALMTNLDLTAVEALTAMGLVDMSVQAQKALMIAPMGVGELAQIIEGSYRVLLAIGDYRLWQVDAPADNLLLVHSELWAMAPTETLGLIAVVQEFGSSFYPAVVKNALGWDNATWLARRNRIATYMNNHGGDGTVVAAATSEDALAKGIATGMGYTEQQLWDAMIP